VSVISGQEGRQRANPFLLAKFLPKRVIMSVVSVRGEKRKGTFLLLDFLSKRVVSVGGREERRKLELSQSLSLGHGPFQVGSLGFSNFLRSLLSHCELS
jgi:hypothetical protein